MILVAYQQKSGCLIIVIINKDLKDLIKIKGSKTVIEGILNILLTLRSI